MRIRTPAVKEAFKGTPHESTACSTVTLNRFPFSFLFLFFFSFQRRPPTIKNGSDLIHVRLMTEQRALGESATRSSGRVSDLCARMQLLIGVGE